DALLIDFAIRCDGYYSDITRTVFLERVEDADRAVYETVLEANRLGREIAAPGMAAGDLDDAVLRVLERSPFARFIMHKTGHGLGLDVHEPPMVMRGNRQELRPGHVLTIEPGLYDPSRLGVRIEDDVLITATGCETLTSFPRELTIVG
ncbi:MAG: M24 family metallopeptidase, partial [Rhodobacteraceae bacterium]|nr:M24 family metallopeptidase [Paracoccaceae bacterium]